MVNILTYNKYFNVISDSKIIGSGTTSSSTIRILPNNNGTYLIKGDNFQVTNLLLSDIQINGVSYPDINTLYNQLGNTIFK